MGMVERRPRIIGAVAALLLSAASATGCAGTAAPAAAGGDSVTLSLVAYSTPQAAYEALIKAFEATPEGKNVTFKQSYGASGDQSRAVASGLKADVVAFSLAPDMSRLVKAGLVADDWNSDSAKGMITDSVVVLVTRKGNPKNVKSWDDITDQGLETITANPFTPGGARWNVMAAYGAASDKGTDK